MSRHCNATGGGDFVEDIILYRLADTDVNKGEANYTRVEKTFPKDYLETEGNYTLTDLNRLREEQSDDLTLPVKLRSMNVYSRALSHNVECQCQSSTDFRSVLNDSSLWNRPLEESLVNRKVLWSVNELLLEKSFMDHPCTQRLVWNENSIASCRRLSLWLRDIVEKVFIKVNKGIKFELILDTGCPFLNADYLVKFYFLRHYVHSLKIIGGVDFENYPDILNILNFKPLHIFELVSSDTDDDLFLEIIQEAQLVEIGLKWAHKITGNFLTKLPNQYFRHLKRFDVAYCDSFPASVMTHVIKIAKNTLSNVNLVTNLILNVSLSDAIFDCHLLQNLSLHFKKFDDHGLFSKLKQFRKLTCLNIFFAEVPNTANKHKLFGKNCMHALVTLNIIIEKEVELTTKYLDSLVESSPRLKVLTFAYLNPLEDIEISMSPLRYKRITKLVMDISHKMDVPEEQRVRNYTDEPLPSKENALVLGSFSLLMEKSTKSEDYVTDDPMVTWWIITCTRKEEQARDLSKLDDDVKMAVQFTNERWNVL